MIASLISLSRLIYWRNLDIWQMHQSQRQGFRKSHNCRMYLGVISSKDLERPGSKVTAVCSG